MTKKGVTYSILSALILVVVAIWFFSSDLPSTIVKQSDDDNGTPDPKFLPKISYACVTDADCTLGDRTQETTVECCNDCTKVVYDYADEKYVGVSVDYFRAWRDARSAICNDVQCTQCTGAFKTENDHLVARCINNVCTKTTPVEGAVDDEDFD